MAATYTWDVFATLDGFGSFTEDGDWGGYWGKEGPEFISHRAAQYQENRRLVLGRNTFISFQRFLGDITPESDADDPVNTRMKYIPTTVISSTLEAPLDWPDATLISGDIVDIVANLKAESDIPLVSHGSMTLNKALLDAGLIDRIQVAIFPVISGQVGCDSLFTGVTDFDLDLLSSKLFDGRIQELTYRPTLHG
ncbi:MAG: dihydrofolate reductase family protein [Candidatus Nanopelagicales bacterium]